jgi:hypothetical protein
MSDRSDDEDRPPRRAAWPRRRFRRRAPGKPGRPRKPPDQLRSQRIRIRLSESELALLKERAEGRPLPSWIRERLLEEPKGPQQGIPLANRLIAGQLARIGNNINQLVRLAHTGRIPVHFKPLLYKLYEAIARYQRELLGSPR